MGSIADRLKSFEKKEEKEKEKNKVVIDDETMKKIMKEQPKPRPSFLYIQMKKDIKNRRANKRYYYFK